MDARILTAPFDSALVVEQPHASLDTWLAEAGIRTTRLAVVPDEDKLIDAINDVGAQILFKRSRVPVTDRLLANCPTLHAVQLCCIGDDSVDKVAAAAHGVMVFNDPVSNARSVVELAVGHLIALSRRLYETDIQMHANDWRKTATGRFEILDKHVGIVGLGNIGRQVARALEGLGMHIHFYDTRHVAQEIGVEMGWTRHDSLDDLFENVDLVTVHTSAVDAKGVPNEGLLDNALGRLGANRPKGAPRIFLNLARGNVYRPEALLDAVASGAIRRAAVDVFPSEPRPGAVDWLNPYAKEPRVICTPHIGAATQEAQPRIARRVAQTMADFSRNGGVRDCVFDGRAMMSVSDARRGQAVLAVVHSTARGTKKAVDDAIYEAEASNLGSTHRDFEVGVAYDLSLLDHALEQGEIEALVARASELAGGRAIRAVRQVTIGS